MSVSQWWVCHPGTGRASNIDIKAARRTNSDKEHVLYYSQRLKRLLCFCQPDSMTGTVGADGEHLSYKACFPNAFFSLFSDGLWLGFCVLWQTWISSQYLRMLHPFPLVHYSIPPGWVLTTHCTDLWVSISAWTSSSSGAACNYRDGATEASVQHIFIHPSWSATAS